MFAHMTVMMMHLKYALSQNKHSTQVNGSFNEQVEIFLWEFYVNEARVDLGCL